MINTYKKIEEPGSSDGGYPEEAVDQDSYHAGSGAGYSSDVGSTGVTATVLAHVGALPQPRHDHTRGHCTYQISPHAGQQYFQKHGRLA